MARERANVSNINSALRPRTTQEHVVSPVSCMCVINGHIVLFLRSDIIIVSWCRLRKSGTSQNGIL